MLRWPVLSTFNDDPEATVGKYAHLTGERWLHTPVFSVFYDGEFVW